MRDTRMIGVLDEQFFQYGGGLQISRIGLIRLCLGAGDIQRAENPRFVVIRIARGQVFKCLGARLLARTFRTGGKILVVRSDCLDVVALTLRFGRDAARMVDGLLSNGRGLGRGTHAGQRIRHQDCGDAPVGDGAGWVLL